MAVDVATRPRPAPPAELTLREQIVEARSVLKTYDTGKVEVHALRGITLGVGRGEMVAIMGPSGCGKTTLLNCLSGLDSIDGGDVLIEGVSLARDVRPRANGLPRSPDGLRLPVLQPDAGAERGRERRVAAARRRGPPKEARRKALDALELVGLRDWAEHVPDELSGGQRQRVTIARALVNNPAIVWADEPTGDLDSENADEIMALMRQLNREHGLTFLIVTHDIGVGRKTDRIVRMVDGRIVSEENLEVNK